MKTILREKIERKNTTQKIPGTLFSQIPETIGNIVKEKIEIMPWVIPKSSYFTPSFEKNNLKENSEKRDKIRDNGDVNTKIGRNMNIWKKARSKVYMRSLKKLQIMRLKIILKKKSIPKGIMIRGRKKREEKVKRDTRNKIMSLL